MHRDFEALQAALDRERARRNAEAMCAAEDDYLEEPEPATWAKTCECCEGVPDDEKLYKYDGEWLCIECLTEALPMRNAFDMREWE